MAVKEYVGCKSIEAADYDGNGNDLCSMWLTEKEIVRCRDCEHFTDGLCGLRKGIGYFAVEPDGFCAWAERRDA